MSLVAQAPIDDHIGIFIERLRMIADLPADAARELAAIVAPPVRFEANQDIVRQGDSPSNCCVVLSGWICRNKVIRSGKRQITALHFAGAMPDLQSLFLPSLDHNITALTAVRIAYIPHHRLRERINRFPALALALWQETILDAAIAREWEVNLGARHAPQRIGHVFCEIATRLDRFGLAESDGTSIRFGWPLTQNQLGEVTGLSAVHVNRSLQLLRATNLVEVNRERVTIPDLTKLKTFADFNPDYLLAERPRGQRERLS